MESEEARFGFQLKTCTTTKPRMENVLHTHQRLAVCKERRRGLCRHRRSVRSMIGIFGGNVCRSIKCGKENTSHA